MTDQPQTQPIRALLVDDHAVFRESVVRALRAEPDLEISHCATIAEAVQRIAQSPVDIVLLDHDLGAERASQFLPASAQVGFTGRVLVVTAWISDNEARRLLRQGVGGIFLKENPLDSLLEAIHTVAAGGVWLDQRFAASVPGADESPDSQVPLRFNDRQRTVLRFVVEGLSNKEIAWRLQISESYVKAILQSLFQKTGVRTRGQLVRVALEQYANQL
jgi:two-component system, NarL family, nitrate/nitrite response regulator NarL